MELKTKKYKKYLKERLLLELWETTKVVKGENCITYITDKTIDTEKLKKLKRIWFYRGICFEVLFLKDTDEPFLIFFCRGFDDSKRDPRITKAWIYRAIYKTYINLNNLEMKTFKIDEFNFELYEIELPPRLNNFIKNWIKKYQTKLIKKIRG